MGKVECRTELRGQFIKLCQETRQDYVTKLGRVNVLLLHINFMLWIMSCLIN